MTALVRPVDNSFTTSKFRGGREGLVEKPNEFVIPSDSTKTVINPWVENTNWSEVLVFPMENHDVPVEFQEFLVCPSPNYLLTVGLLVGVVERDDTAAAPQPLILGNLIHEQGKINDAVTVCIFCGADDERYMTIRSDMSGARLYRFPPSRKKTVERHIAEISRGKTIAPGGLLPVRGV